VYFLLLLFYIQQDVHLLHRLIHQLDEVQVHHHQLLYLHLRKLLD